MGKTRTLAILGVIFIVVSLGLYMYHISDDSSELKEKMEYASRDYFEKYVSLAETSSAYNVTLKMLEDANRSGETYDLNGLEGCNKEKTFVIVTIDYKTGKPKNAEVKLNC